MQIDLAITHILPYPTWTDCSHVSGLGELFTGWICSPLSKADKHSPDREGQIIQIGKERCERGLKATSHSTIFDIPMHPVCEDQRQR